MSVHTQQRFSIITRKNISFSHDSHGEQRSSSARCGGRLQFKKRGLEQTRWFFTVSALWLHNRLSALRPKSYCTHAIVSQMKTRVCVCESLLFESEWGQEVPAKVFSSLFNPENMLWPFTGLKLCSSLAFILTANLTTSWALVVIKLLFRISPGHFQSKWPRYIWQFWRFPIAA